MRIPVGEVGDSGNTGTWLPQSINRGLFSLNVRAMSRTALPSSRSCDATRIEGRAFESLGEPIQGIGELAIGGIPKKESASRGS